jgi:phage shock protein A
VAALEATCAKQQGLLAQFASRDSALAGASEMAGRTAQLLALDKQQLEASLRALHRDIAELRARNEALQVSGGCG